MNKRYISTSLLMIFLSGSLSVRATNLIQEWIDAAQPGEEINIPSGLYAGPIVLKEGITLIGEDPAQTIIDGSGKGTIITGANDAKIIGLTLRNGAYGVKNAERYMGVFECRFENIKRVAIMMTRGAGVLCNNRLSGIRNTIGIYALSSNPFICNNEITGYRTGLQISGEYEPYISKNIFRNNRVAILATRSANALIQSNLFEGNDVAAKNLLLPQGNHVNTGKTLNGFGPSQRESAYAYVMDALFPELIANHAGVIYELDNPATGSFKVLTDHPTATFTVTAATRDTLIQNFGAYDAHTELPLHSEKKTPEKANPKVVASNPELTEKDPGRYQLDQVYQHPKSLYKEDATLRFKRQTNLTRITVVAPAGYVPASANYPYEIEKLGDQVALHIIDVGMTDLDIEWQQQ